DAIRGHSFLARALARRKKLADSAKEYLLGIEAGRKLTKDHPGHAYALLELAAVCHNLANVYTEGLERYEDAVKLYREAEGYLEKIARPGSVWAWPHRDLSNTRACLARTLSRLGRHDEACKAAKAGVDGMRALAEGPRALALYRLYFVSLMRDYAG